VAASEHELRIRLDSILRASDDCMLVLDAVRAANLPQWRLFSGAVYQTVWNALSGRCASYGIRDYDIGYFDLDLSPTAEQANQCIVRSKLPAVVAEHLEVANQARVHLWFEQQFGRPYPALLSTDEALRRCLATVHAVGIRLEQDGSITIAAPYGLSDIFDLVLRPAPTLDADDRRAFLAKAADAQARWPEIRVIA
jgi:uncharacterized protein